jgi:hypothetical protein
MSIPVTQDTNDCFDDVISLRGACGNQRPTSGIYLDAYGMSLLEINKYISEDYESGEDLFKEKRTAAIQIIESMVLTAMHPKIKAKTLIENYKVGFSNDNLQVIAPSGPNKGLNIKIENTSSFLTLFMSQISLQLNYTGDVDIYLADLRQSKIIETFQVATSPQEITTIYPQYSLPIEKGTTDLILFYDTTGRPSYKTTVNSSGCSGCQPFNRNGMVSVKAFTLADAVQKIASNLQTSEDTGGLSINYSLSCDYRAWLCSTSNLFAMPIAYKTIVEILDYAINSYTERINNATIVDREQLEKRKVEWEFKFREALDRSVRAMNVKDHTCFECNSIIQNVIALP